jgi:hypothetical protein
MGDQAYFGKEKSLSSIFPSQTVDAGSIVAWSILQGNRRMTISLKNIGLISHFAELHLLTPSR